MKNTNKGFTLIELLAVIVILAVVALIATPIIINVIENSRKESAELSMKSIEKSAELYFYNKAIDGENGSTTFICDDGTCSNGVDTLEIDGVSPDKGQIIIDEDGIVTTKLILINNYYCSKVDGKYNCEMSGNIEKNTDNGVLVLDSASALVNYQIQGNSIQKTTPTISKPVEIESVGDKTVNLLPKFSNETKSGVTLTVDEDGTCHLNGTATANTFFHVDVNLGEGDYVLSVNNAVAHSNTGSYLQFKYSDIEYTGSPVASFLNANASKPVTVSGRTITGVRIRIAGGATFNDYIIKPQLQKGTIATDYEPYNKYKIPITISGKNLFDYETNLKATNYGLTNAVNEDGSITTTGIPTKDYVSILDQDITTKLKDRQTYTLSQNKETNVFVRMIVKNKDTNTQTFLSAASGKNTFVVDKSTNTYLIQILSGSMADWGSNSRTITNYYQLEEGSSTTNFESYMKPITTKIYLDEPLRKVNKYFDYIDFATGTLVRKIKHLEFNGLETSWQKSTQSDNRFLFYVNNEPYHTIKDAPRLLCDRLISNRLREVGTIDTSSNNESGTQLVFGMEYDTVDAYTQYLKNQYSAGTPLYIEYALYQPETYKIELPNINLRGKNLKIEVDTSVKPNEFILDYYK